MNPLYKRPPLRLVEKTPANSLRVPCLASRCPDAKWPFFVRRGEDVVSSLIEGRKNWSDTGGGHWHFTRWHFLVPPAWQEYRDRRPEEICAFQWTESNRICWEDLNAYLPDRFLMHQHEDLMADPRGEYAKIREYYGLRPSPWFDSVISNLRAGVFTTGGSAPRLGKWADLHETEISSIQHLLEPVSEIFYR